MQHELVLASSKPQRGFRMTYTHHFSVRPRTLHGRGYLSTDSHAHSLLSMHLLTELGQKQVTWWGCPNTTMASHVYHTVSSDHKFIKSPGA